MKKKFLAFLALFFVFIQSMTASASLYRGEELSSDVVYVVNQNTGISIFEKNINKRRCPASITKIMTFIVVYENTKNRDETMAQVLLPALKLIEDDEAQICGLRDGEVFSVTALLHCLMISSGCDAALVLADHVGNGDIDKFVQMMNDKAISLGCADTHFTNPHGLYNEELYSTAADLYKIASYAMKIPEFAQIVKKTQCSVFGDERDPLVTTNKMLDKNRGGKYYYPYVQGIRTGYCNEAGRCLVSIATKNECTYMCIILGAPTTDEKGNRLKDNIAMIETKKIYSWIFDNLKLEKIYSTDFPLGEVNLELAWRKDKLLLVPEKEVGVILPKNADRNDINIKFDLPKTVEAPVKQGDIIGTVSFLFGNQTLCSVKLVSSETIAKNFIMTLIRTFKNIFTSPIFVTIFIILILVVSFFLAGIISKNKELKKRNKIKKFSKKYNLRKR